MTMHEIIRAQMEKTVPFARHAGIELTEIEDGKATAILPQSDTSVNHVGSQHAGALFTLGEAASGGAMAGTFAQHIMSIRPLAGAAQIRYNRIAKGTITAIAQTAEAPTSLVEKLESDGKVAFAVNVNLRDNNGETVASMTVDWHVKKQS
jgi:acyl-coenzyme A thioesterase PaaI-like protein